MNEPSEIGPEKVSRTVSGIAYGLLAALVVGIAVAGFGTFVTYLRLDLAAFAASGLLLLGVAAGAASFFSPCSFPLLVTLLARESSAEPDPGPSGAKALRFAAALAIGLTSFLVLTGALLALGAGRIVREVTFTSDPGRILRVIVGGFLTVLGLFQIRGLRFTPADRLRRPLQSLQAKLRRKSPGLGFALFGFGYVLAGFG